MSITAYDTIRLGETTEVTVTSSLLGTVYYHWYVDGVLVASTTSPRRSFVLAAGDMVRIEVIDTNDADYDPVANAPAGWPARRLLWWVRSIDEDVDLKSYRVDQKKGAGDYAAIATVQAIAGQWDYQLLTDRLDDLATYTWRIVPIDPAGNDGTPLTLGPEKIVRTPDAPKFAVSYDEGTTKVTFSAA